MSDLDREAVRNQIEAALQREKRLMRGIFFALSLFLYIALMIVGWSLFLGNGGTLPSANIPGTARAANPLGDAMMFASLAGFVPVLFQFVTLILETRIGERQLRERVTGRILAEALLDQDEQMPKAKRKRAVQFSEEGELEDSADPALTEPVIETRTEQGHSRR